MTAEEVDIGEVEAAFILVRLGFKIVDKMGKETTEAELYKILNQHGYGLCPVCGSLVIENGITTDGRVILGCGDAVTDEAWKEDPYGNKDS